MISKLLAFSLFEATETEDSPVTSMDGKSALSNEAGPKRCETRCMKIRGWGSKPNASRGSKPNAEC